MSILHPEHTADLQKSGLTEASIAAADIHAVPPGKLEKKLGPKLAPHVLHAYAIPYRTLEGTVNGFERLKLFPSPGHTLDVRYWQEPESPVHLYLPPGPDWKQIASDPTIHLTLTEGEKKALCACQHGLDTSAVGGCWNFRTKTDDGQCLTLPELDSFVWKDREVEIVPDSDGWRKEKLFDVLAGFYVLAMELTSRGARVVFVRLLDAPALPKTGLDDWFVREGTSWREAWGHLERIQLTDRRLYSVVKWWQRWREKQATQEAFKSHDAEALDLSEAAGLYTVTSAAHAVRFIFDRLTEQGSRISAEVTAMIGTTEVLPTTDLGLKSNAGKTDLARSLAQVAPTVPWKVLLSKACDLVLRRHREGEPTVLLDKDTACEPLTYAINPLVFIKKISVLFATGGMAKSTLALFLAMCTSVGAAVAGIRALRGSVLYLDFEDDAGVHARRLHAIQAGHPELQEARVIYQRCVEPISKLTPVLVRLVRQHDVSFVVVDSLLAATGGDSSAEATTKLFIALRTLNASALLIGHTPKTQAEGQEHATIYGSVFNSNFSRSVWEVQKEQEVGEDSMILALVHRKANLSRLHQPIGLQVTQSEDNSLIRFESFDLSQAAELEQALPYPNRIRNFLEQDGGVYSNKEISEGTGIPLKIVRSTMTRGKGRKWSAIGEGRNTKWTALNHG